jgi:hypothetical protein
MANSSLETVAIEFIFCARPTERKRKEREGERKGELMQDQKK